MREEAQTLEGLGDLHRALDDATEMLSALVSVVVSQEVPPIRLLEAAGDAIDRLAMWRAGISQILQHDGATAGRGARDDLH